MEMPVQLARAVSDHRRLCCREVTLLRCPSGCLVQTILFFNRTITPIEAWFLQAIKASKSLAGQLLTKLSQNPKNSLYSEVDHSNPELISSSFSSPLSSSSSSLYPSIDMKDLTRNLFPENESMSYNIIPILDLNPLRLHPPKKYSSKFRTPWPTSSTGKQSVDLASGNSRSFVSEKANSVSAVLARAGDEIQWLLAKHEAIVKVDESHYFILRQRGKRGCRRRLMRFWNNKVRFRCRRKRRRMK